MLAANMSPNLTRTSLASCDKIGCMNAYDILASRAAQVRVAPGTTSYFSGVETHLDPALFNPRTNMLLPNVRMQIMSTLYTFWESRYSQAHTWSTVWVAGSGASYQWSAARSPGDLDVLIGVNYAQFRQTNQRFAGLGDIEISKMMDDEFRNILDLRTAHTILNGSIYEETFYVNPGATDIRAIMPYAAYNVTTNTWTVPPDANAKAPRSRDFVTAAREDKSKAKQILADYNRALREVEKSKDPATRLNNESWLKYTVEQGSQFFDEIHTGRHAAFRPGGTGYSDWHNFRWQAGKAGGYVPALQQLKILKTQAQNAIETKLYGAPIPDAEHALLKAAIWKAGQ